MFAHFNIDTALEIALCQFFDWVLEILFIIQFHMTIIVFCIKHQVHINSQEKWIYQVQKFPITRSLFEIYRNVIFPPTHPLYITCTCIWRRHRRECVAWELYYCTTPGLLRSLARISGKSEALSRRALALNRRKLL